MIKQDEYELINDLVSMIVESMNRIEGYEEEKEYALKNVCCLVEFLLDKVNEVEK